MEKRYGVRFAVPDVPSGVCLRARASSFDLLVPWGERIALRGRNGAGKTTLLETFLGLSRVCASEVHWDSEAVIGYLPQRWNDTQDARPLAERFLRSQQDEARILLGALGVKGDHFTAPLGALSEGQKCKVRLVETILKRPNVLVLDEPTTHLDYVSIEILETALFNFPGTILLVSHDRYLLERIAERTVALD